MLVKYKPASGGSYALLFDESAGDTVEKFAPVFRDLIQKVPGYGASNQTKVPMSNTDGQLPLRWSSNYATADAATTAIYMIRAAFKGLAVHLQVIVGATTVYFPNATLSSSSHEQHGKECLHALTFETDDITTTAP